MPLQPGSSREAIKTNIKELMKSSKKKGKIGRVKTPTRKKAAQVAAAIAYRKARGS